MNKNLFSTTEIAELLGISREAVLKKIKTGNLKARKVGRNYVINKADLPIEVGGELTDAKKDLINRAVKKTVVEYGETLRLLGKE
ncbi:helix-turn-helix domain-containing protein [Patescibacteria group bacterium]|nr:helix-turn-helix domain-containing protein [Patescibacteria group bacterium]